MSSAYSAKSQIPALKVYIATSSVTLLNADGSAGGASVGSGTTLRDMGTTVFLDNGDVLRKVEGLPVPSIGGYLTGYINLGPSSPTLGIVRMN